MTVITGEPRCSSCKGTKFRKLPMRGEENDVRKCSKCGQLTDFALKVEDQKHLNYHTKGEPDDKMNITGESDDS